MGEITKGVFGLNNYVICFYDDNDIPNDPQKAYIKPNYYRAVSRDRETFDRFRTLEEKDFTIDTDLEFALASYYSPALVQIRPPEAAAILPENNKTSGLKLASAVLHKLAEIKFLTPQDKDAVGRYEGMVKFIQDKHGLSRAEIDKYYRDAVRAETAQIISVEFNKISFMMDSPTGGYGAELKRNAQNGQYTLKYKNKDFETKEISAVSLNALLDKLSKLTAEFSQASITAIKENVAKMPGAVYGADALNLLADAFAVFYTEPQEGYKVLQGIYARIFSQSGREACLDSFQNTVQEILPKEIANKLLEPWQYFAHLDTFARYPSDPRYDVFGKR